MQIKIPNIIALLIVGGIVILSYGLAWFAPFLSLDDMAILDGLQSTEHSIVQLFLHGGGDYYRPLTFVSFIFDLHMWGRSAVAFHMVNVSIHLINSLLVYHLAWQCDKGVPHSDNNVALISALLFAVHPVNVESVMWVAGRTDLLCCLFFLMALIVVIEEKLSIIISVISLFLLVLLSLWSKEASISMTGILLVLWFFRRNEVDSRRTLYLVLSSFAATLLYMLMRSGLHGKLDTGVSKVWAGGISKPFWQVLYESCAAFGFYISKFIYPFPLNFAIVTINQRLSFLFAVFAIAVCIALFRRFPKTRLPLLIIMILLIPPVMALQGKLPWTPYAERYLYLPMIGFCLIIASIASRLPRQASLILLIAVMLLSVPTMQRVALWTDQKAFWLDVLKKSPGFPRSYVGVAVELLNEKKYGDAELLYNKALEMGLDRNYVWQGLAEIRLAKGDLSGYEAAMLRVAELSPNSTTVYINLITTLLKKKPDAGTHHRIISYYLLANQKMPSYGDGLYNAAKEYMFLGDTHNALKYFKLFIQYPGDSIFMPFAEKIVQKIEDAKSNSSVQSNNQLR